MDSELKVKDAVKKIGAELIRVQKRMENVIRNMEEYLKSVLGQNFLPVFRGNFFQGKPKVTCASTRVIIRSGKRATRIEASLLHQLLMPRGCVGEL